MKSDSGNTARTSIWPYSFLLVIATVLFFAPQEMLAQPNGESLFKANCSSCHSAGSKKGTGPGLAGATKRRSMEWLLKWVANPAEMVASGDADALAIMKEYNNFPMPPQPLNEEEVKAIFSFIDAKELAEIEKAKADSLAKVAQASALPTVQPLAPYISNEIEIALIIIIGVFILFFAFMRHVNQIMVKAVGHGLPVFDNTENGWTDKWIEKNRPFAIFLGMGAVVVGLYLVWLYVSRF